MYKLIMSVLLALTLTACGGGGSGTPVVNEPDGYVCTSDNESYWVGTDHLVFTENYCNNITTISYSGTEWSQVAYYDGLDYRYPAIGDVFTIVDRNSDPYIVMVTTFNNNTWTETNEAVYSWDENYQAFTIGDVVVDEFTTPDHWEYVKDFYPVTVNQDVILITE